MGTGVPADLITRSLYRLELCQRQILRVISGLNLPADDVERAFNPCACNPANALVWLAHSSSKPSVSTAGPAAEAAGAEATASPAVPEIRTSTVVAAAKILRVLCCLQ